MYQHNLEISYIEFNSGKSFDTDLRKCIKEMVLKTTSQNYTLLKLTAFSNCISLQDYESKINKLSTILKEASLTIPFSLISQSPQNESSLIFEVWFLKSSNNTTYTSYNHNGINYGILLDASDKYLILSANCFSQTSFEKNTSQVFEHVNELLIKEGFEFSDVIRQWNYIENIFTITPKNGKTIQNYQLLNDYRSVYYSKAHFSNGFPAATGIGTRNGGFTLELIALKNGPKTHIVPITNPIQTNAHAYSKELLADSTTTEVMNKTTPKFERAKCIHNYTEGLIFVSGTASILQERTVFENNITEQTTLVCKAIDALLSKENSAISSLEMSNNYSQRILNYRVYVKNKMDMQIVETICKNHFGNTPSIILEADICRENLLVEIELLVVSC